ncbi:MAG: response regulator [Acidobacteriota bacterium]
MIKSDPAKILIADDEEDTRQFLLDLLTELGHKTTAVASGKEAVELAQREQPDVILLDVMMPELSGLEVCQLLKEQVETKDIPIIFVTAKVSVNDQILGLHKGAHDYINKPYRVTELTARLNAAIRLKRLQDELKQRNRDFQELAGKLQTQVCQPLEASAKLAKGLAKQNFSRHTRDSLAKIDQTIGSSLQHLKALFDLEKKH